MSGMIGPSVDESNQYPKSKSTKAIIAPHARPIANNLKLILDNLANHSNHPVSRSRIGRFNLAL